MRSEVSTHVYADSLTEVVTSQLQHLSLRNPVAAKLDPAYDFEAPLIVVERVVEPI